MKLSKDVFEVDNVFKGVIPTGDDQCRFDYNILEKAIKEIVNKKLQDESSIMQTTAPGTCPTFVVAIPVLHADGPPGVFRSYKCTGASPSKCTIWEAGRATSAAPLFFKPIRIDVPSPGRTFADGGLGHNNPAEVALKEASRLWGNGQRCCLVSIGTGRQKTVR